MALTKVSYSMITGALVNVKDFGAVADGNYLTGTGTDNSAIFQTAINYVAANDATLFIPAGIYRLASTINIPSNVTVTGAGNFNTVLFANNSFTSSSGLLRLNGAGGPPTVIQDMAIIGALGGAGVGSVGLNMAANGSFAKNLWVSAFNTNVIMSNSDTFLLDSAIEETLSGGTGVYVNNPSNNVTIANCVLYRCYQGLVIENTPFVDGTISVSNCRSVFCVYSGFTIINSSNVQISNCSVGHNTNAAYTYAGITISSSSNVVVSNFIAKVGATSVAGLGIEVTSSNNVLISNSQISNFHYGIKILSSLGIVVNGCQTINNGFVGIAAIAGDQISIDGCIASSNGTGAVSDTGVLSDNSAGFSIHSITNCVTTQTGGGVQDYGIKANLVDNGLSTGTTNLIGNISKYNNISDLDLTGKVDAFNCQSNIPANSNVTKSNGVAMATTLTLPAKQGLITVSGFGVTATTITAAGYAGAMVTLMFQDANTLTNSSTLKLAGGVNFVSTANDTITLACDGTTWFEVSRSIN